MNAKNQLKTYLILLLVMGMLLVSCSASQEGIVSDAYSSQPSMGNSSGAPQEEREYDSMTLSADASMPQIERMMIQNASLSIAVDDPAASMTRISSMAEEMGGFVVSATLYQTNLADGQKAPRGSITVRVPAERLQEALAQIRAEASVPVISENISSQDVTSEYTDLDSRVRNLEAAEKQLQAILERATKTEDVLDIFNRLTQVREQIEMLKGQMKYYAQSAALSAIGVELVPNVAVQPVTIAGWQPQGIARQAVQALVNTLKGLATAGIWLVIYVLPVLLVLLVPVVLLVNLVRRWQRSRRKVPVIVSPEPPTA